MKISSFQRIVKENFSSDDAQIVDGIGGSFNGFADQLTNALNKNLTVEDNLNMFYKDIDLSVNASGTPTIVTEFKSLLNTKVKGLMIINLQNLTNTTSYPTGAPFISFAENNKLVRILNVTGLSVTTKYRLTLLVLG